MALCNAALLADIESLPAAERAEYDAWSDEYARSFGEPDFADMSAVSALGAASFGGARDDAPCGFAIMSAKEARA